MPSIPLVRRHLILTLTALFAAAPLFAEPAEKVFGGRTMAQRFGPLDQKLVFNPEQGAVHGKTFSARVAQTPEFHYDQRVAPTKFEAREYQPKASWLSKLKFWAKDANVKTGREIPNASRQAETKAVPVRMAFDAPKAAPVRDVSDGKRPYLGPESKKLKVAVDPKTMADWRNNGWSVGNSGTSVERYGSLKQLSVEDVREILNKNK